MILDNEDQRPLLLLGLDAVTATGEKAARGLIALFDSVRSADVVSARTGKGDGAPSFDNNPGPAEG